MSRSRRTSRDNTPEPLSPPKNRKTVSINLQNKHPQISQQFIEYQSSLDHNHNHNHNHNDNDNNDQQQTARVRSRPFHGLASFSPIKQASQPKNCNTVDSSLAELTNQINIQRQTITKISHVIDYLTQQNQQLNLKYVEAVGDLERAQAFYQDKLQTAYNIIKELQEKCSKNETAATSFIQSKPLSARITPMKVYNKNNNECYGVSFNESESSSLTELSRIVIAERVYNFEKSLRKLEDLTEIEMSEVSALVDQQKYMEAYIEDQVLNPLQSLTKEKYDSQQSQKSKQTTPNPMDLLELYKTQLIQWQNYANALKKQLIDCLTFIEKFITVKDLQTKKKKSYTNEDLIKYITKEICKKVKTKANKKQKQIKQLRTLLEDAFTELKKHEQKEKTLLQS